MLAHNSAAPHISTIQCANMRDSLSFYISRPMRKFSWQLGNSKPQALIYLYALNLTVLQRLVQDTFLFLGHQGL